MPDFAPFAAPQSYSPIGTQGAGTTRMGPDGLEIFDPQTLRWIPYGQQGGGASPGFSVQPPVTVGTANSPALPLTPATQGAVSLDKAGAIYQPTPSGTTPAPPTTAPTTGPAWTTGIPPPTHTVIPPTPPPPAAPYAHPAVPITSTVTTPPPVNTNTSGYQGYLAYFQRPDFQFLGRAGYAPTTPVSEAEWNRINTAWQQNQPQGATTPPPPSGPAWTTGIPPPTHTVAPPTAPLPAPYAHPGSPVLAPHPTTTTPRTFQNKALGFAEGGAIQGPGGPRQDNLLVRASNGEFVVPADVVRHKGTEFFHKLIDKTRETTSPGFGGFAEGGEVVDPSQAIDMPASASPGYAPLPPEGQAAEPAFAGATAQATQATQAPQPANPVAAYKAERTAGDQEYLRNLPTAQKIGLALQAFGAGVTGGPNPIDVLLNRKRQSEQEARAEIGSNLAILEKGIDIVRKLRPGEGRNAVIEQYGRIGGPLIANALKTVGTDQEAATKQIVTLFENPAVQEMATKMVAGSPDPRAELERILSNPSKMAALEKRGDQATLPTVVNKMRIISRAMSNMPQYRDANGNASFSKIDLLTQNADLPPNLQFSPAELQTIERNQPALIPFGLKTDKVQEIGQEAAARRAEQPPRTRNRIVGENEIQEEFNPATKAWEQVGQGPRFARQVAPIVNVDTGNPGGKGATILQDDSGVKYSMNTATGKAFKMGDDGEWESINPNTVPTNAQKVGAGKAGQGAREAVFTQRVVQSAGQAASDLENVARMPLSASTGLFGGRQQGPGLMDATKNVLANTVTGQEAQSYNVKATGFQRSLAAIEAAGLMPTGNLTHQMDAVLWKEGDTNFTKMQKLAQTRQIVDSGLDVMLSNPRVSDTEKDKIRQIQQRLRQAVPFTHDDLDRLQTMQQNNPDATLKDVLKGGRTPATNAKGWKLYTDKNGAQAYVSPDGKKFEEVK